MMIKVPYTSNLLMLLFFFMRITCFSQEKEIVKILNQELTKEIENQFNYRGFANDTLSVINAYNIDADKILSVTVKKSNNGGYRIEKQEVPLSKINVIGKDINIILETDGKQVKKTTLSFYKNLQKNDFLDQSNLFFTHLHFPNNEQIAEDLIKAFAKAGYNIKKSYWYD